MSRLRRPQEDEDCDTCAVLKARNVVTRSHSSTSSAGGAKPATQTSSSPSTTPTSAPRAEAAPTHTTTPNAHPTTAAHTQPSDPSTAKTQEKPGSSNAPQQPPQQQEQRDFGEWPRARAPNLEGIGNAGWTLLHTVAAYYPERPSASKQEDMGHFLHSFARVFPCRMCADDFANIMEQHPPRLSSQRDLALWMCEAHNRVNEQLGKPAFPCERVDERWKRTLHHTYDDDDDA